MTTRISLRSAALALGMFAALPALAQTQTMTPASPAPSAQSGTPSNVKLPANDEHKSKGKAAKEKTSHEQVAQRPGAATKTDSTVKPDTSSK